MSQPDSKLLRRTLFAGAGTAGVVLPIAIVLGMLTNIDAAFSGKQLCLSCASTRA